MSNFDVISNREIFKQYQRGIAVAHQKKMAASNYVVNYIVQIGTICQEAKNYKDKLNIKNKNQLWQEFSNDLPISKSSISKYISVATHPIISLKKYQKFLPPSVYSLYELSKIPKVKLEKLITTHKVHADMGRSELHSLLGANASTQSTKRIGAATANAVEILSLSLPQENWEDHYESIKDELMTFLSAKGIDYELGSEIRKREKLESTQRAHVNKFMLSSLKKYCSTRIKDYINTKGQQQNLFGGQTLSFDKKIKLVGLNKDEVNFSHCITVDEVHEMYLNLGLGEDQEWQKIYLDFFAVAHEQYPYPDHLLEQANKPQKMDFERLPPKKKRDFTGFKV